MQWFNAVCGETATPAAAAQPEMSVVSAHCVRVRVRVRMCVRARVCVSCVQCVYVCVRV